MFCVLFDFQIPLIFKPYAIVLNWSKTPILLWLFTKLSRLIRLRNSKHFYALSISLM